MSFHNKTVIDVLHITSWDTDHCTYDDLTQILNQCRPSLIEVPPYEPVSEEGILCRSVIFKYDHIHQKYVNNVQVFTREYVVGLTPAEPRTDNNIICPSAFNSYNKNDMSSIKLFRSPGFNVISFGDCESKDIALGLIFPGSLLRTEVDVMILSHHGANNGFTCPELLDAMKPQLAICSSNYGNHYDHPRPEVCSLLSYRDIPLRTTKRGDVIVYHVNGDPGAVAVNMVANNEEVDTRIGFIPKRYQ
jgi:competence protein ComEC